MKPAHGTSSDNELLQRCRDGDAEAFGAIYDRYGNILYGTALRMLRRHEWMDMVEAEFDITVNERSRVVEISGGRMPERNESWWRRVFGGNREISWAMDVVLRVPAETALRLENRYGNVQVDGIGGDLEIDNASGEVTVSNTGRTTIANSYGPIDVEQVRGELRVRGSSAEVNIDGVRGDADVETSYGELIVENVEGRLRAVASSGAVRVINVSGFAEVINSYASAEVRDVAELSLGGSSSDVTVVGVRGPANIEVDWPGSTPLAFDAECTYGRIESDFEGRLEEQSSSSRRFISEASGGGRMSLVATSGSITLNRR